MNNIEWDADLLSLLPPWYREVLDYQEICRTEQERFDALAKSIAAVADNFFFQTMDAAAVAQWERIFRIIPNPVRETLEFRRFRLLSRISSRPPYTLGFLYQKLDELIGAGLWEVSVDYPNYTLYIESSAQNQQYAEEISYTIHAVKPAHIVYINRPFIRTALLLSEQIELFQRIYNYKLGSWGLGLLPFAAESPQGVIKLASVPSVQESLLSGTASFISGDIVSARINGTIIIGRLTKTVVGNKTAVTYTVTPDQAPAITSVELLDADGNALTAANVYVPVIENTVLKHIIPVKEGAQYGE